MDVKAAKKLLRKKIWLKLEKKGVAKFPLPCFGRIPNFVGSGNAAAKVRLLDEWQNAKVVFVNPDYAQRKVRECALLDGKILVMASSRLKHGFIVISPKDVKGAESFASTIKGAFKYGRTIDVDDIPRPDLVVEGAVAVDLRGNRLGKGHGYGDLEISILKRIFGSIPVVTTVHDTQIVEAVPSEEKDEKIGLIVTPTRIIRISPYFL
ncbi:MAG: 5-formyltetrahydrofolate cyclo-ligase [Candidatus Bathyarchaeota archaeon]|nr:5-formyltetrahydrofolate cyclo-ligase [Candidatus Bathyarchaeota archaeon]MDH5787606.1 5-formyltetrahydrofolate cyclo-ligase [Candidatus Bathyarchaeota archaeon]